MVIRLGPQDFKEASHGSDVDERKPISTEQSLAVVFIVGTLCGKQVWGIGGRSIEIATIQRVPQISQQIRCIAATARPAPDRARPPGLCATGLFPERQAFCPRICDVHDEWTGIDIGQKNLRQSASLQVAHPRPIAPYLFGLGWLGIQAMTLEWSTWRRSWFLVGHACRKISRLTIRQPQSFSNSTASTSKSRSPDTSTCASPATASCMNG